MKVDTGVFILTAFLKTDAVSAQGGPVSCGGPDPCPFPLWCSGWGLYEQPVFGLTTTLPPSPLAGAVAGNGAGGCECPLEGGRRGHVGPEHRGFGSNRAL